jgi:hypothetical protein
MDDLFYSTSPTLRPAIVTVTGAMMGDEGFAHRCWVAMDRGRTQRRMPRSTAPGNR